VAKKLVLSPIYSLLTPWNRVLLEKITSFQLVKKFPALYETQMFITAFTSACRLSLSWASSIQSIPPQPTTWRSILILLSTPGSPKWSSSLRSPHMCYMPCPFHSSNFVTWTILGEEYRSLCSSLCSFLHSPVTLSLFQIFSFTPYSQTSSTYGPPSMWATKFHTHTKQQIKLEFCIS